MASLGHLFFTNNHLCFMQANKKLSTSVRIILWDFTKLTSLKVNYYKSALCLHADQMKSSVDIWTSQWKTLPWPDKNYNRLIERLQIFLNRWKRTPSSTGILQLINWTKYVKLYHWFQVYNLQKETLHIATSYKEGDIHSQTRSLFGWMRGHY